MAVDHLTLKVHCRELHSSIRVGTGEQSFRWLAFVVRDMYAARFPQYNKEQFTPVFVCDKTQRALFPQNIISETIEDGDDVYVELLGPSIGVSDASVKRERSLWEMYAYYPPERFVPVAILFDTNGLPDLQGSIVGVFGSFNSWAMPLTMQPLTPTVFQATIRLPAGAPICFKFVLNDDHVVSQHYPIVTDANGALMNYIVVANTTAPLPSAADLALGAPTIARDVRVNPTDDLATHLPALLAKTSLTTTSANANATSSTAALLTPQPSIPLNGLGPHTVLTASQLFGNTVSALALAAAGTHGATTSARHGSKADTSGHATASRSAAAAGPMSSKLITTTSTYLPPPFGPASSLPPPPTLANAYTHHENNAAVSHVTLVPSMGISLASPLLSPISFSRVVHEACSLPPGLSPATVIAALECVNKERERMATERAHRLAREAAEAAGETILEERKDADIFSPASPAPTATAGASAGGNRLAGKGAPEQTSDSDDSAMLLSLLGLRHNTLCPGQQSPFHSLTPVHKVAPPNPFAKMISLPPRVTGVFTGVSMLSVEMLSRLFECDWALIDVSDLTKTKSEGLRVREILWKYSAEVRALFRHFAQSPAPPHLSHAAAGAGLAAHAQAVTEAESKKLKNARTRGAMLPMLSLCLLLHAMRVPETVLVLAKVGDVLTREEKRVTALAGAAAASAAAATGTGVASGSSSSSTSSSISTSTISSTGISDARTRLARDRDASLPFDAALSRPQLMETLIRVAVTLHPHLIPSEALDAFFTHYFPFEAAYPAEDAVYNHQIAALRKTLCNPALHTRLLSHLHRIVSVFARHSVSAELAPKLQLQCGISLSHHTHLQQQTQRLLIQQHARSEGSSVLDSSLSSAVASLRHSSHTARGAGAGAALTAKLLPARAFEAVLHKHKLLDGSLPRRHALAAFQMSIGAYTHPNNTAILEHHEHQVLGTTVVPNASVPPASPVAGEPVVPALTIPSTPAPGAMGSPLAVSSPITRVSSAAVPGAGSVPSSAPSTAPTLGPASFELGSEASLSEFTEALVRVALVRHPEEDIGEAIDIVMGKLVGETGAEQQ